jgi:DNA-binding transcriptional regulator YdaS (Cro superfamily)
MNTSTLNTMLLALLLALSAWTVNQVHSTAVNVAALAEHANGLDQRVASIERQISKYAD